MDSKKPDIKQLKLRANAIRQDIVKMLLEAKSGHTAGPMGMADVFTALYFHSMKHDPKNWKMDTRDRCVLSNAHICPVLYATLAHAGYFPTSELMTLRKLGTRLHGHQHMGATPGLETTGGPLAQGISNAVGMALAAKMDGKKHHVFVLTGDGEHDEGQVWEAVMLAAKYKLSNLIQIVDYNNIQIDGPVEKVMPLEPFADKYKAFGWEVVELKDGNDMAQVVAAIDKAKKLSETCGKPIIIIARTLAGKGCSLFEGKYGWHGRVPNAEEAKVALSELEGERKKIEAS